MLARHRRSRSGLSFERLENRELLAANGFSTTPLASVMSSTGETFEVGLDRRGRIVVSSKAADVTGAVKISVNDYEITNADGTEFTGDLNAESKFTATPEAGPGRARLPLSFQGLLDLAAQEINRVEGGGFRVSEPKGSFDTLTLESPAFGGTVDDPASITVSTGLLFKPFAQLDVFGGTGGVGEPQTLSIGVRDTVFNSPLIDKTQPVELAIDLGDGTVVNRTVTNIFAPVQITHTYAVAGDYTVTVTGTATPNGTTSQVGGTIALREVCADIQIRGNATVTDTPGDDDISLRNENGRVIAKVNGADQDLGASGEIGRVEVQLGRGNNSVDASGLLPTQSLFVPSIVNLSSETNTITGGPGDDVISGGRGPDDIRGGDGDDTLTPNRGADIVDGGGGSDTIQIAGGFSFGEAFNTDIKQLLGGDSGFDLDVLKVLDIQDDLDVVGLGASNPGFEAVISFFKGIGSSAPRVDAHVGGFEEFKIDPQTAKLFVNLANLNFVDRVMVDGSPENDRVNFTNSTFEAIAKLGAGNDTYLGSAATDAVDGGSGDDVLNGNEGDDVLSGGTGANELDGGAGDDRYSLFFSESGEEPTFDEITDTSGDRDAIGLIGFVQGLALNLDTGATQEIAPGVSIDLNLQTGRPIEDVAFQPTGDQPFTFNGTNSDNVFSVVPIDIQFGVPGQTPVVTIGDGLGGNDLVTEDPDGLTRFNPFDFAPEAAFPGSEGLLLDIDSAPNSGDVIDLSPNAVVTAGFPDAFRAVNVDLDLQGVDQVVDVNGNTTRFDSPVRHFVGSAFDDTLQIDANLSPRRAAGGGGTDSVTIDAGGRPVTQTVDGAETTVQVAGFAPIVVTEFEAITIANEGPAGGLAFDLSPGADNALLSLQSIVDDGATVFGRFTLSESLGAFPEQSFLHQGGVTEIRSAGGDDNLTIDAQGRPVEVVGADILIGGLPAIRLVGFSEVTIEDAGLPGDYNRDRRVNAADYTVWRDSVGAAAGALPNDIDGGEIGQAQYDTWVANYGRSAGAEVFVLPAPTTEVPAQPAELEAIDLALAHLGVTADRASLPPSATIDGPPTAAATDELLLLIALQDGRQAEQDRDERGEAGDEPDVGSSDEAEPRGFVSADNGRVTVKPRAAFRLR